MTKHTPGPWRVANTNRGWMIAQQDKAGYFIEANSRLYHDEMESNARLIAAAPELLEALRYLLAAQSQPFDHADRRASKVQAIAAIAKAEGGAS